MAPRPGSFGHRHTRDEAAAADGKNRCSLSGVMGLTSGCFLGQKRVPTQLGGGPLCAPIAVVPTSTRLTPKPTCVIHASASWSREDCTRFGGEVSRHPQVESLGRDRSRARRRRRRGKGVRPNLAEEDSQRGSQINVSRCTFGSGKPRQTKNPSPTLPSRPVSTSRCIASERPGLSGCCSAHSSSLFFNS